MAGMELEQGSAGMVSWHGMTGHTMTCTGMEQRAKAGSSGAKGTPHPSPPYLGWLGGTLLRSGLGVAWPPFITALGCTGRRDVASDSPGSAHVASFPLITTH